MLNKKIVMSKVLFHYMFFQATKLNVAAIITFCMQRRHHAFTNISSQA